MGHTEPVYLLDCGLTASQRALLAPHVTLIRAPSETPPYLLKTVAPLRHPAEVTVLLDVDMVVTRPLMGLFEKAHRGRVVAFENKEQRFVPEWGELLDLGTARRQPYLSSGLVLLGGSLGQEVLRLWDERQRAVDFELTFWRNNVRGYPFLYGDQDVLNAVLATRVGSDRLVILDNRLAANPPYRGLRVVDRGTLRCAYRDGSEPYVLHQHVLKPWLHEQYHGAYSRLLSRLLVGPDIPVKVPEPEIPLRMRNGRRARAARARLNLRRGFGWHVGDPLRQWIRTQLEPPRRRAWKQP